MSSTAARLQVQPLSTPGTQLWPAYAMLALAPLCWAGNHIVGRLTASVIPPGSLSVVRWLITALVVLPFAWPHLQRDWPELMAKRRAMIWLALAGGGIFGTLQFIGLQHTTAVNVAVFNSLVPVCIILANLALFREGVHRGQVKGIIISLTGVLVIIAKGDVQRLAQLNFNGGDLIIIANMMLFGIYSTCLRLKPNVHWLTFLLALAVVSGVANIPLAMWEMANGQTIPLTAFSLAAMLYVGLISSALAYGCWSIGVARIGAARGGVFLHLIPFYGALLSTAFLGEHIRLFHVIGLTAILTGVALASRRP